VGATVSIVPDKLPRLAKYVPPKPVAAPKVEIAKVAPKPEPVAAGPAAPEKPAATGSPKVLAAIAEARQQETRAKAKAEREAEENVKLIAARIAKVEAARPATPAPVKLAARKPVTESRPNVVPAPVDQDRLQFLRIHEANLASARIPQEMTMRAEGGAPSADLSERMKGSILDSGLPSGGARH
jgi:hypothetical protein